METAYFKTAMQRQMSCDTNEAILIASLIFKALGCNLKRPEVKSGKATPDDLINALLETSEYLHV